MAKASRSNVDINPFEFDEDGKKLYYGKLPLNYDINEFEKINKQDFEDRLWVRCYDILDAEEYSQIDKALTYRKKYTKNSNGEYMIPVKNYINDKIVFVTGGIFDFKISKVILVNDYLIKNKENKQEIIEYILNFKGENYDKISKEIWDIIFIDSRENFQFDIWENGRKKLGSNKGNSIDNGNGRRNTEEIRENKSDSVYGRGKRGKNETRFSKSKIDSNGNKLTDEQIEYFKNSAVRDENGNLIPLYHGTTWEFYTFDKNKANAEGDMGKGFYFTNQEFDADSNYADSYNSPDLKNKIERLAERIEYTDEVDYDMSMGLL